jgi:hypothetical protein
MGTLTPRHKSSVLSNQDLRIVHKLHWGTELVARNRLCKGSRVHFSPVAWFLFCYVDVLGVVCGGSHVVKKGNSSENAHKRERSQD